jgi:hypothetical protein
VTLLPSTAAAVEARPGSGLAVAAFHDPAPGRCVALVHRASSPRAAEFASLAGTIRAAVEAHGLAVRAGAKPHGLAVRAGAAISRSDVAQAPGPGAVELSRSS